MALYGVAGRDTERQQLTVSMFECVFVGSPMEVMV